MEVTIYHNPSCSKSRQTLQLLKDKGIKPEIIEYLKDPPNKSKLQAILTLLNMQPRDLMRTKEATYKEQKLDNEKRSTDELLAGLVNYPILIERPIVLANNKAAIGRPPENILEIL